MSDYGTSGDPASELQGLLATGAVGGALQQYITATLGALWLPCSCWVRCAAQA